MASPLRYPNIWSGWRERLQGLIVTHEEAEYFQNSRGEVQRYVIRRRRRFCGWENLLFPKAGNPSS